MNPLWIHVTEVTGVCTGSAPMAAGMGFVVEDGSLRVPGAHPICLFALQSLLPLLPAKERRIEEDPTEDWMWRVHAVQCPDPKGRVVWRIDPCVPDHVPTAYRRLPEPCAGDLLIEVEEVRGKCTSGMHPGGRLLARGSSLYIPEPFCLYALAAVLPLLPAVQRPLPEDDWLNRENRVICPDPAGNVVLGLHRVP
ncbi:MAG: TIGR04076 family protein [Candidatus Bipolaricaulota bacterium]|nr:MAG: TIGR04076 family protein [Candidatus Bipolaricaulota bacterium]